MRPYIPIGRRTFMGNVRTGSFQAKGRRILSAYRLSESDDMENIYRRVSALYHMCKVLCQKTPQRGEALDLQGTPQGTDIYPKAH